MPLLNILAASTEESVPFEKATQELQASYPQYSFEELKRLTSLAHGELLAQGLTEKFRKGYWKVSRKGISLSKTVGISGVLPEDAETERDIPEVTTPVVVRKAEQTSLQSKIAPVDYKYLMAAAMNMKAACFGKHAPQAKPCQECLLAENCIRATQLDLARLADVLVAEERAAAEEARRRKAEEDRRKTGDEARKNAPPPPAAQAAKPKDPKAIRLTSVGTTACAGCGKMITGGSSIIFQKDRGQFHEGCYQ